LEWGARRVVSVIKRKLNNTYFLIALLPRFYGESFIWLSIFILQKTLLISLAIGCLEFKRKKNPTLEWACVLYYGQFGM
jgi:hypothetical protein